MTSETTTTKKKTLKLLRHSWEELLHVGWFGMKNVTSIFLYLVSSGIITSFVHKTQNMNGWMNDSKIPKQTDNQSLSGNLQLAQIHWIQHSLSSKQASNDIGVCVLTLLLLWGIFHIYCHRSPHDCLNLTQ